MVVDGGFICDAATFFWLELGCSLLVVSSLVPVAAAVAAAVDDTAEDEEDGVNGWCASFGATDLRTDARIDCFNFTFNSCIKDYKNIKVRFLRAGMPDERVGIPVGVFLAVFEAWCLFGSIVSVITMR